jgi:hypothetical protein
MNKMKTYLLCCAAAATWGCGGAVLSQGDGLVGEEGDTHDVADLHDADVPQEGGDPDEDAPPEIVPDPPVEGDAPAEPDLEDGEEPGVFQCSDGLDNDGDGLPDMEDFDCTSPGDPLEGPDVGECTTDHQCSGGWGECDKTSNICYAPPQGLPCEPCYTSSNCGDGVTGDNPDRDWCVYWGIRGSCTKDCNGDADCPRAYVCDYGEDGPPLGYCVPLAGTCDDLGLLGSTCEGGDDCGNAVCNGGICTTECAKLHDCPEASTCVDGLCAF